MSLLLVVTVVSIVVAAAMSVVAWRARHEEQRRSSARVAALSAEVFADAPPPDRAVSISPARVPAAPRPEAPRLVRSAAAAAAPAPLYIRQPEGPDLQLQPMAASSPDMFAPRETVRAGSRLATVVAIGVFVVGVAGALAVVLSGSRAGVAADRAAGSAATPAAPAALAPPLELVSLTHERESGRLLVRGIVRNPISAKAVSGLSAVVSAFGRDGAPAGTGQAVLDLPTLAPGTESSFAVPLALGGVAIERYRISFRTDSGVVAHVDKRSPDARR